VTEQGAYFCKFCGARLPVTRADELIRVVDRRLEAIRRRDGRLLEDIVEREVYTKFDDWPPFYRQDAEVALKNEKDAYRVLSDYGYELKDVKVEVWDEAALATYHIKYWGTIRGRYFNVASRVTMVFRRRDQGWRLVHEHWSRFPDRSSSRHILQT
jgi:hypothetical protein